MAAGDVVITMNVRTEGYRLMAGTVVLDGSNPTPVDLSLYMASVAFGIANMDGSVAPGDDPDYVTSNAAAAAILNVYAWKNTGGTDPSLVASTDNARLIDWFAAGPELPRKGQ